MLKLSIEHRIEALFLCSKAEVNDGLSNAYCTESVMYWNEYDKHLYIKKINMIITRSLIFPIDIKAYWWQ